MVTEHLSNLIVEQRAIGSEHLKRYVIIDLYMPTNVSDPSKMSLLLINDGQNLDEMPFASMLNEMLSADIIEPLFCVGIHADKNRKNEYGTARIPDYAGRGAKASAFESFILEELLPFIQSSYGISRFRQRAYAGFSLGGLSALDITWHQPETFSVAGVFSGSLWWRSKALGDGYNDDTDRIMHQQIRNSERRNGLRFYFTTGSFDEKADRNNNGIIDSIDDTLDLIRELNVHGYHDPYELTYFNDEHGQHDVSTWAKCMPAFLLWGWGK